MLQLPDLYIFDNTQLTLSAAACLGLVVGVLSWVYLSQSKDRLPRPPSPPTWRLLGHFLPRRNSFLTIAGWIDEHGPLITLRSGFQKIVIIGRYKAVVDIMESQGGSLADRPRKVAAGEIFSGGLGIASAPFGDRFRRMRRALHTHLQPKAAATYEGLQMSHVKNTVLNILDDPYNVQNHVVTYAATTITKVAYGSTTPFSATDPQVIEMHEIMKLVSKILRPDAYYLVESIPWLKHIPWYGRELKQGFEKSKKLHVGQLNRVREQMQRNEDIGPSFMKYMLENKDVHRLTDPETAFLAGAFFGAGSDTIGVAICIVLLAAACFPEEQAKFCKFNDLRTQAPTFADQQSLVHLRAFIYEALRWRPITPNGIAHRTTKDVIWENYCIPAGTTVYGNNWAICRDPEVFPEPDAFKLERWIDDQGRLRDDLNNFVYGFGRRICPGEHVANRAVFINALLIFWAFRLTVDPTKPLDDMEFMTGERSDRPCPIKIETRISETELRRMMQNYPEAAY
ncbi:cytochrome P450 [Suillus paluster]|uniref:cytochrome P450 n=1 Tax=Suillus paluster TaxID=48578 RepID=UPI001B85CD0D|nr:cytochrome P450 [Suillus paluster]KAG1728981.1 cytochrome P450 [Suillus paluster]